ncbi:MAG TPA: LamG domain-containing protein, partial [Candidatus Paceibacterota bacterium]
LVVISIIGLLSSVVLSSLNTAREKARIASGQAFHTQMHSINGANAILMLSLDEGSGSQTANTADGTDASLINNPTWTDGILRNALDFNGTNYVLTTDLRARADLVGGAQGAILITTWIYPTEHSGDYRMIANGLPGILYFAIDPSRRLRIMTRDYSNIINSNYWPTSNAIIPLNKWTHVALLIDGGVGYKFFIDGKLDKEEAVPLLSIENMSGNPTSIGRSHSSVGIELGRYFRGKIDDFRVYYYIY